MKDQSANKAAVENAARERIKKLLDLQKVLFDAYGEDNYNVFVFGSYPTVRFDSAKSDADIAVYTPDFELYKKISVTIDDFFFKNSISVDLFYIDTTIPAPIYLAPLHAQIQMTDYYPEELSEFEKKCSFALMQIKEEMAG